MEFKQLEVFISVAENLNFSKTAEYFSLTQPTISKNIKALEHELGTNLFERNKNQLSLTFEGKLFLQEAKKIIQISHKMKNSLDEIPTDRTFRIGFVALSIYSFLPAFTTYIQQTFPDLKIKLEWYYDNLLLLKQLQEGHMDLAFYYETNVSYNIESRLINEDEVVLVQSVNSPFADLELMKPEHAPHMKYILPPREANPYMMDVLFNRYEAWGLTPEVVCYLQPHQARLALAAENTGVLLEGQSLQKLHTPGVVFTPIQKDLQTFIRVFMGWNPYQKNTKLIQHFIAYFDSMPINQV
ncbi:hypothetical protein BKI52_22795 [marine bacterium AO1-C]|nr:hypothetical protein BKI52_22795 [marine bacterium AO1-C]